MVYIFYGTEQTSLNKKNIGGVFFENYCYKCLRFFNKLHVQILI